MIRFGILGFGLHAVRRLMPGFADAKHCTVAGLWRRDTHKAQEAICQYPNFPLKSYGTPEALCASPEIDAIFGCSSGQTGTLRETDGDECAPGRANG